MSAPENFDLLGGVFTRSTEILTFNDHFTLKAGKEEANSIIFVLIKSIDTF